MQPLLSSAEFISDPDELRGRLIEHGYLYLPGFLPVPDVQETRSALAEVLVAEGWVTDPETLTMSRTAPVFDRASFAEVYASVQRVEAPHRLARHPSLGRLATALLGGAVFCHPARAIRLAAPQSGAYSTRAHQDFAGLHVAADVLTCWIPLSECNSSRQGLRVLPGSHRGGYLPVDPSQGGARPLYVGTHPDDDRWATTDFAPGDVLLFHSFTVHAGGPNRSDLLRLSVDARYQRTDEPLLSEYTHPHGWPRTPDWDVLARTWTDQSLHGLPEGVETIQTDPATPYEDRIRGLSTPRSRLLGPPRN